MSLVLVVQECFSTSTSGSRIVLLVLVILKMVSTSYFYTHFYRFLPASCLDFWGCASLAVIDYFMSVQKLYMYIFTPNVINARSIVFSTWIVETMFAISNEVL